MVTAHQPSVSDLLAGDAGPQSRLSMIAQVTDRFARTLDFGKAMRALIEDATALLGVERGALLLLDQNSRTLSIAAAHGIDGEAMRSTSIQVGFGIAGAVAETGRPLIEKRSPTAGTVASADRPDSGLCVPVAIHGKLLGVMAFEDKKTATRFRRTDLEFAQLIANQAGIALYCDLLHEELQDELAEEASRLEDAAAPAPVRRMAAA